MGSADIQAKIKRGLAKAVSKTGSLSSDKIYLVSETRTGGDGVTPPTITSTDILLVNAVFKSYDASMIDTEILTGDRMLVSDNSVAIKQGDKIKEGSKEYVVISVDIKSPTSDRLAYISQVREL